MRHGTEEKKILVARYHAERLSPKSEPVLGLREVPSILRLSLTLCRRVI